MPPLSLYKLWRCRHPSGRKWTPSSLSSLLSWRCQQTGQHCCTCQHSSDNQWTVCTRCMQDYQFRRGETKSKWYTLLISVNRSVYKYSHWSITEIFPPRPVAEGRYLKESKKKQDKIEQKQQQQQQNEHAPNNICFSKKKRYAIYLNTINCNSRKAAKPTLYKKYFVCKDMPVKFCLSLISTSLSTVCLCVRAWALAYVRRCVVYFSRERYI